MTPDDQVLAQIEAAARTGATELNLSNRGLTRLPAEIRQLTNLRTLNLHNNQLSELSAEIGQLTNLETLWLNNNQLSEVPAEIGQLTNLRTLYLYSNQLSEVPAEIVQLANLRTLSLSGNQLSEVPAEIVQLINLRTLFLYSNHLTDVPAEIEQLTNLQALFLSDNQLTEVPAAIVQLTNLQQLHLNSNQLTEVPAAIGQLTNLETLHLNSNQLSELPAEIEQLTNLQALFLSDNHLTDVPAEIGQLTNLQRLDLENNQLREVPAEIGQLTNLQRLDLGNNPLPEAILNAAKRGTEELLVVLRSLLEERLPQYEAKLLLVGEGAVGKSSLAAAMRGEPFVRDRPTTHGIELGQLSLKHPDAAIKQPITLNTWDFGGQEVYRITHQFFFTPRALYLLCWHPRAGAGGEAGDVAGWLQRIRLRVPSARVMLVATYCDEKGARRPDIDYDDLNRRFPEMLAGLYEVDSETHAGVPELLDAVTREAARLDHMGEPINPKWKEARDQILDVGDWQVSRERCDEICTEAGLSDQETDALLAQMHALGRVIYYGDDAGLMNSVVLNPEWLTKAISFLLDDRATADAGGIVDHGRLSDIWQEHGRGEHEPSYPHQCHPFFLRMMEKCDITYRIPDSEGQQSLVGQMVPAVPPPDLPWRAEDPLPPGGRELSLVCTMGGGTAGPRPLADRTQPRLQRPPAALAARGIPGTSAERRAF